MADEEQLAILRQGVEVWMAALTTVRVAAAEAA